MLQEPLSVVTGATVPGGGSFTEHEYTRGAGVSAYELDLFGKLRNLSRAAQDQYFATRDARDAAQIALVGEVARKT